MKSTDIPTKFAIPFANNAANGTIRPVPQASQTSIDIGQASLTDGFPAATGQPLASGGKPPAMQDFNGILYQTTAWSRWQAAAGLVPYDTAFSTAVGGYPAGATVLSATTLGRVWVSTADNNTTNPDSGGANWLALMLASDVLALIRANSPIIPTSSPILYVDAGAGSDTNVGTQAAPFRSIAAAAGYGLTHYFLASSTLTLQLLGSTAFAPVGNLGGSGAYITIKGDPNNPSGYVIAGSTVSGASALIAAVNGTLTLQGLTVQNTGSTLNEVGATSGALYLSSVVLTSTVTNGAASISSGTGGNVIIQSGVSMGGNHASGMVAAGGSILVTAPITIAGSPTYSGAFAQSLAAGSNISIQPGGGFNNAGNAIGKRYAVDYLGLIQANGAGQAAFPGNQPGSVGTYGGQYAP